MTHRYFEDFAVGQTFGSGRLIDELRWTRPVRPGDELHLETEVLEVRPSKSRPKQGSIKARTTTLNQNGEAVQILVANLIAHRRHAHIESQESSAGA